MKARLEILILVGLAVLIFLPTLSGKLLVMMDAITDGIYTMHYVVETRKFWNPYMFYGMPTIPTLHITYYPLNALMFLTGVKYYLAIFPLIHVLISGLSMFLLVYYLLRDRSLAFLSALAYMLTPLIYGYIYSGHLGKLSIFAFLPVYFLTLYMFIHKPNLRNFFLLTLSLSFIALAGHIQMIYYLVIFTFMFLAFFLSELLKDKRRFIKTLGLGLLSIVVVLAISLGYLLPFYDYATNYSHRGGIKDYSFAISWSLSWQDYVSLFIPGFSGFSVDSMFARYWGENAFKINSEYIGASLGIFLPLSVFVRRYAKLRNFLIASFIVFSIIALGGNTPIYKLIWSILPAYKNFRAPSMAIYLAIFSAVLLVPLVLQEIRETWNERRKFLLAIFPVGLLVLLVIASPSLFTNDPQKLLIANEDWSKVRFSIVLALVFALLSSAVVFMYVRKRFGLKQTAYMLSLIVALDLFMVSRIFLKYLEDEYSLFGEDGVVRFLKSQEGYYKVYPFLYRNEDNYLLYHKVESIGGHHGVQPGRFFKLIGAERALMFNPITSKHLLMYPRLNDVLSVRFVITQKLPKELANANPIVSAFFNLIQKGGYVKVYDDGVFEIYENPNYLPKIRSQGIYKVSNKPLEDVLSYKDTLILEESPNLVGNQAQPCMLNVERYEEDRMVIQANCNTPSFIVISENYHHSWKALVDGKPTKVFRANFVQMALEVPEGKHRIEIFYDASFEVKTILLSLFGFLLVLLGSIVCSVRRDC